MRGVTRRQLLAGALGSSVGYGQAPGFQLVDVTAAAGLSFVHENGAYGAKYLPETMGPGCAFLDYDNDGWLDILLVNGMGWPGHGGRRTTMRLFKNNRRGGFTDVTREAGLDVEMYGLGVAVGDFNNDGYPDLYVTAVGQSRLFQNNGRGGFTDVTKRAGLGGREGFSTSALWFDYDRDGFLDLFVCNYVRWDREKDVFCSLDGKTKSYCTPEAYRGSTCWLFRNKGDGTFEDVTAKSGIFDPSSKSLGVALLDVDGDGWPDLFVANDTQPNKLYRNRRDGTFEEMAVKLGVAFSEDGRARAGMGVDAGDFDRRGHDGLLVTNFDNEMMGLYGWNGKSFADVAMKSGIAAASRGRLGFGCFFFDADLDGYLDVLAVNGHIDSSVRILGKGQAQKPNLFLNDGKGKFREAVDAVGGEFAAPKIGRGVAFGDFDRDGDLDVLLTTNGGPAHLYRNDIRNGNRSLRLKLEGRKSNRSAIGAVVEVWDGAGIDRRMVRSGGSYLSSSEPTLTFGLGRRERAEKVIVRWPSGGTQEFTRLAAGKSFLCVEGERLREL